jgi:hypothetical protein
MVGNQNTNGINNFLIFLTNNFRGAAALWAVAPLADLPAGPAGRAVTVKAGRKPVHFSLDGRWLLCYSMSVVSPPSFSETAD